MQKVQINVIEVRMTSNPYFFHFVVSYQKPEALYCILLIR